MSARRNCLQSRVLEASIVLVVALVRSAERIVIQRMVATSPKQ